MSSPTMYPGDERTFAVRALLSDGVSQGDFRKKPIWKIDNEQLLEIVEVAPDGSTVTVRALHGSDWRKNELVTLSVVNDLTDAPGLVNSGDSFEIYCRSRLPPTSCKIVELE